MAKPFKGTVIALSGTFEFPQGVFLFSTPFYSVMSVRRLVTNRLNRQFFFVDNLKQIIEKGGGIFSSTVGRSCTHLVTTPKNAVNTNTKCKSMFGSRNLCQLITSTKPLMLGFSQASFCSRQMPHRDSGLAPGI